MWKRIVQGIAGSLAWELGASRRGPAKWKTLLAEGGMLLGFAAASSWLVWR